MKRSALWAPALLAVAAAATGCNNAGSCTPTASDAGATPQAKNYLITLKATHAHIYRKAAQLFTVYDMDTCTSATDLATCKAISGLPVKATIRSPLANAAAVALQPLETGKLEDNGDGTYTLFTSFGGFGAYTLTLLFEEGGFSYFQSFALETSKGGAEGLQCDTDADGTADRVFQIRWHATTERVIADDQTVTTFLVEVQRSFNTPLNLDQPWSNSFDHLAGTDLEGGKLTVKLMGDTGADAKELETLTANYLGKGLFEVKKTFGEADFGAGMTRTFWLAISFKDDLACVVDASSKQEEYHFATEHQM